MSTTQNYAFEKEIGTFDTIDRELKRVEDKADQNIATKVDKIDGHSLIPADKLEQITENKNHIECLGGRIDRAYSDIADCYTKTEVDAKLECKASKCELEKHIIDPHAHQELFDQKADKADFLEKMGSINIQLDNKVDKVSGYGLVSDSDRLQIGVNKDDISKMYTQAEVDALLSNKANSTDIYTKTQIDNQMVNKASITKLTGISMPWATGWSNAPGFVSYYCKDQFGIVYLSVTANKSSAITEESIIATIPTGYRPSGALSIAGFFNSPDLLARITIGSNGSISVGNNTATITQTSIRFTASFLAS